MTVVTDGIDGQMKVFVTESLYGDVEYYKGLGIVIEPGHTYNIGQFKEWAFKALVKLISYPEGFGEEGAVLSDVQEVVEYVLETKEPTLNFPAKGGDDMCVVTSSKQTFKNGQPVGHPEGVPVEFSISGAGFKVDGGGQVTVDENPNNTTRKAVVTVKQNESGKTLQITCNQAASTVTYEYALTVDPTSVTFDGAGGEKLVTVTSTRTKVLNGVKQQAESYPTDIELAGEGFSYEVSGNNYNLKAEENTGTSQRTGKATISQEGGKTVQMNLTQNAATVTYDYALTVDPTSVTFDGAGGEKLVTVTSTRTKVLNGVKQQAESYPTDIELAGEGFSYEVSGNNYNLKAEENTGTSQRTGKATISQEGGKTVQMNLTQNAATVTYDYALTANSQTIQFVALVETKSLQVVSTRQKKVNGKPSGDVEKVDTTAQITGTGFSETSSETTNGENYSIVAAENKAETANNGSITITQTGSNKTVKVTLTQLAAAITYEYTLTTDPTALSFAAAGETKIFGVSSKKQKKVNGKNDGSPMTVDYTTVVSGTGFTKGSTEYSVVADANTGAQRTGTAVVTAVEGGKKETVNLTQLAGE
jgi:hypothetical protein